MSTPEGKIQKYAKERFEAIGGLVRKLSYENRRAAMDLLVILPYGIIWFVEVKKDEILLENIMEMKLDNSKYVVEKKSILHELMEIKLKLMKGGL